MKYENARDILPPDVFALVQKHAAGKLLYVPQTNARLAWGERSGYRRQLDSRNADIRRRFESGERLETLADEYFLTPETIRKIVYSRKEKNTVDLNDIFKLWSEDAPDAHTFIFDEEWEESDREGGLLVTVIARWGARRLHISVGDYVYITHQRIVDMDRQSRAYAAAGIPCALIVPVCSGELWRDVVFRDHSCIAFAWDIPEGYEPKMSACDAGPFNEYGRYLWHEDIIAELARMAALGLDLKSESSLELFDRNSSCFGKYEDWNAEEFSDMIARYHEACPELEEKIAAVEKAYAKIRDALRPMYAKLPRSAFPGGWWGAIVVNNNLTKCAILDLTDGGSMACAAHIVCESVTTTEHLPDSYSLLELSDPAVQKLRTEATARDIRLFAQHYPLNDDERAAIPLMYRMVGVPRDFAWGATEQIIAEGTETCEKALDHMLARLTSEDIDFDEVFK